jgi:hypothetical protein
MYDKGLLFLAPGWIIESFFGDVEYLELRVGCTN